MQDEQDFLAQTWRPSSQNKELESPDTRYDEVTKNRSCSMNGRVNFSHLCPILKVFSKRRRRLNPNRKKRHFLSKLNVSSLARDVHQRSRSVGETVEASGLLLTLDLDSSRRSSVVNVRKNFERAVDSCFLVYICTDVLYLYEVFGSVYILPVVDLR